jgi:hypothetical protein
MAQEGANVAINFFGKRAGAEETLACVQAASADRGHADRDHLVVCTENLRSGVVVVKSAKDGVRTDHTGSLNRARNRRILV